MVEAAEGLKLDPPDLTNGSANVELSQLKSTKFEQISGSADECEVESGIDLASAFEPFERRAELLAPLITYGQVVHGDVVLIIQQQCLLVTLNSRGELVVCCHSDAFLQPKISIATIGELAKLFFLR